MITITRRQLHTLQNVLKKSVWHRTPRGLRPPVVFDGGAEGLTIRSHSATVAIEFHVPGPRLERTVRLPATAIEEIAARDDTPVTFEQVLQNQSLTRWDDNGLPQCRECQVPDISRISAFPDRPQAARAVAVELLAAIDRAGSCIDRNSSRYELDHIQLSGSRGQVAAADGRQVLVEGGFQFPWEDDRLVIWSPVFGAKELTAAAAVEIGAVPNGIYFGLGAWSVWLLGSPEARFPKLGTVFPLSASATHQLEISDADAAFLMGALPRLPECEGDTQPVELIFADRVTIQATGDNQSRPTELVLNWSRYEWDRGHFATDRRFLARALELGFREVSFYSGHRALCESANRRHLWALCEPGPAIPSNVEPVRIESQTAYPQVTVTKKPKRILPMASVQEPTKKRTQAQPAPTDAPAVGSPLEKALAVRAALREALAANYELVAALKRHKRQNRIVESTLASLKELQKIGA